MSTCAPGLERLSSDPFLSKVGSASSSCAPPPLVPPMPTKVCVGVSITPCLQSAIDQCVSFPKSRYRAYLTPEELSTLNNLLLGARSPSIHEPNQDSSCTVRTLQPSPSPPVFVHPSLKTLKLHYVDLDPPKKSRTSSSESSYQKRKAHLSALAERRVYSSMVAELPSTSPHLTGPSKQSISISDELNTVSNVASIALNLILAPVTVSFALYVVSGYVFREPDVTKVSILCVVGEEHTRQRFQ